MSDYLPAEVMIETLSRLLVKSLLKFRCVCKSWNSLITSPNFIKIHLNQAKTSKKKLLLTSYMSSKTPNEQYSIRFDNSGFDEYFTFKCPFKAKAYFRVVGVCNGLICLSDDRFGRTHAPIIWNPAIQRFLELPTPSVNLDSYGPYMPDLGFGFDAGKDECKVVRLAYLKRKDKRYMFASTSKVEVYAVSTGYWRTIKRGVPSCGIVDSIWSQVFLNGAVHWTGFMSGSEGAQSVVLSFHMAEEKFRIFELPEPNGNVNPMNAAIGLCGDSLALFGYEYDHPLECTSFAVFVMKEYGVADSWSLIYRVKMTIRALLGVREDGEILVATTDNELASVDPNSKQATNLGICGYTGSLYAAAYEESLALLNGFNQGLAGQLKSYESLVSSEDSSDDEEEKNEVEVDEQYIEGGIMVQYILAAASVPGADLPPLLDIFLR